MGNPETYINWHLEEENMIAHERTRYIGFSRVFKRTPVIAALLIVVLLPFSAFAFDVYLGTHETGTFSYFAGRSICRVVNQQADEINCLPVAADDDMHNLTNLRSGSLDIGLIDSRMLHDAINKAGYFEFLDIKYDNLRALLPLYDVPVTLVVRNDSKITSLGELKGKRINIGAPLSSERLAVETILKAKNWTRKDFRLADELSNSQSQDRLAFCHGTVQAMFYLGVHPAPTIEQLIRLCRASLVNLDDGDIQRMVKGHPAYLNVEIAPDMYATQTQGIATFGTTMVLVASADLDDQTVYAITKAIEDNHKRLQSGHPALLSSAAEIDQNKIVGLQLHPGAVKYFSENPK